MIGGGSIHAVIKMGVSEGAINSRQLYSMSERSRRKKEDILEKKRNRIEHTPSQELRTVTTTTADISLLNNYVEALRSDNCEKAIEGAKYIRKLLSQNNKQIVDAVIATGVICEFVKYLSCNNLPKLQIESAWALTNISSGTAEQTAAVVNMGAIAPLLQLLQSEVFEVAEQAVWAIGNIAGDNDDYRKMILESDGFTRIIDFAMKYMNMKSALRNCVWCLSNLCRNQKRIDGMFCYIQPHLDFLQRMLYCDDEEIVADVCWAFSFLTDCANDQKKEVIPFIDPTFLMKLILTKSQRIQCPALRIAGNIVSGEEADTQIMLNADLVKVLAELIPTATEIRKKEILWIISNITAGRPYQINRVIECGFIPYLVDTINKDTPVLQHEALYALCNAINGGSKEQIRYIVENHVIQPFVRMLHQGLPQKLTYSILVSIYRILKVGKMIKDCCQLDKNPYLDDFNDVGGVDIVESIRSQGNDLYNVVCDHLLRYCDLEEDEEEQQLNI